MNKRLFLALALSLGVILLTQKIFPPMRPPIAPTTDSAAHDGANRPAASETPQAPSAAPQTTGPQTAARPQAGAIKSDTISLRTPLVGYRFSTTGAAPVDVELRQFLRQREHPEPVTLVHPGAPLLSYEMIAGPDTLRFDSINFDVDSSATAGRPALRFQGRSGGAPLSVAYTFAPDSYLVHVEGSIGAASGDRFVLIHLPNGLPTSEADTMDDQRHFAFAVKPVADDVHGLPFSKLDNPEVRIERGPLVWVASKNKYFVVALLVPKGATPFSAASFQGAPRVGKNVVAASATIAVPIGADGRFTFDLYTGPQEWRRLVALGRDFENVNPYGGFLRAIVQPFATIVMQVLLWMHDKLRLSYGWVLVIFGIVVRIALWPLNQSAMRTNLRMQRIQPELQAIQKKYRTDPEKMQQELFKLYSAHGMSALSPLYGCLPMLIPMPVLFALFFVFQNTIEFRGVPFLWLPDISRYDPWYILPIVMAASMFLLSWISLRNSPPNPQAQTMAYVFPVMMGVLFLRFPAGLNLYYAVQNIAALPQQWLIARERAQSTPATTTAPTAKSPRSARAP